MHILLASSSPRRRALLDQIDVPYRVQAPNVDEEAILAHAMPPGVFPSLEMSRIAACRLAEAKAESVIASLRAAAVAVGAGPPETPLPDTCVVVAADTMVLCDGRVLNKPADADDAKRMLRALSGRRHHVVTGLCARPFSRDSSDSSIHRSEAAVTEVTFRALSDDLIEAYVRSGEPLDKAGAYGIQGLGAALVERVDGCYNNVVGLPLALLCHVLDEIGHPVQTFWR